MVKNNKETKKRKAKKGKIIAPIVLVLLVAGLAFGYVALKNKNEAAEKAKEGSEESGDYIDVAGKSTFTVTNITVNEGFSFSYINDEWVYDADEKFPLNSEVLAEMASAAKTFNAKSRVADPVEDISEYGLTEPELTVTAKYSDDSAVFCEFGIENSFNGYRYFKVSGDDNIYMAETSLADTFDKDLNDVFKKETWPLSEDSVFASSVSSILIETAGGRSKDITDSDLIEELYDSVYKLNLNNWEDYYADENEMLDTYGIGENGDKITVSYTCKQEETDADGNTTTTDVPKTYVLYVGLEFESADDDNAEASKGYFYTQQGSTVVYTADAETVDTILSYLD